MERTSQVLAMRAPGSDWMGLARRLGQRFGEHATAARIHDRFVADNGADFKSETSDIERIPTPKPTGSETLVALEEVAPCNASTCSDTPTIILEQGSAANDVACEDPAISEDDDEPWPRDALAANRLGDLANTDTAPSARPTSYALYHAARVHRSKLVAEIVGAAIQAVGAIARRALARHRQRRQARTASDALHQLDGRTLRDLGFDRSEITSLAAELTGAAESTRVRALQTSPGLPK
jgi:uncharacterized protein YjiS (DUF1127 family)